MRVVTTIKCFLRRCRVHVVRRSQCSNCYRRKILTYLRRNKLVENLRRAIYKYIFLNEKYCLLIQVSFIFVSLSLSLALSLLSLSLYIYLYIYMIPNNCGSTKSSFQERARGKAHYFYPGSLGPKFHANRI